MAWWEGVPLGDKRLWDMLALSGSPGKVEAGAWRRGFLGEARLMCTWGFQWKGERFGMTGEAGG